MLPEEHRLITAANQTELTAKKRNGGTIGGDLSYDAAALTLSLAIAWTQACRKWRIYCFNRSSLIELETSTEKTLNFTFDNVAPNLTEVATSNGKLAPGSGVNKWMNFVEATLSDNLQDGLSLSDSTIRLTGPNGHCPGTANTASCQ